MEKFDKYIGSTFYFIPYEFKENCKQGKPTEIREYKLVRKEEPNYAIHNWANTYVFESPKYPPIRFIEPLLPDFLDAKITTNNGIGLYFTLAEAKKAANTYIEKEIAKIERSIQSAQERKKKLNNCLI